MVGFATVILGCSGGSGAGEGRTPTGPDDSTPSAVASGGTANSSPTKQETPGEGLHIPGTRTGVPVVDQFLDLLEQMDASALADTARWATLPCTTNPLDRSVPRCPDGSVEGTMLPGLRAAHCETTWITQRDQLEMRLGELALDSTYLYGVYRRAGDVTVPGLTTIQAAPSLTHLAPPFFLLNGEGHLVGIGRLCNWVTVLDSVPVSDWILPPVPR